MQVHESCTCNRCSARSRNVVHHASIDEAASLCDIPKAAAVGVDDRGTLIITGACQYACLYVALLRCGNAQKC